MKQILHLVPFQNFIFLFFDSDLLFPRNRASQASFKAVLIAVYVMIFLLKQRLFIKIEFYDNSWVLDFYDYESRHFIQINHFLIFTWSKKLSHDFYT